MTLKILNNLVSGACGVCGVDGWFKKPHVAQIRLIRLWGWVRRGVMGDQGWMTGWTSHQHTHSEESSDMSDRNICSACNISLINWCAPFVSDAVSVPYSCMPCILLSSSLPIGLGVEDGPKRPWVSQNVHLSHYVNSRDGEKSHLVNHWLIRSTSSWKKCEHLHFCNMNIERPIWDQEAC